MASISWSDLKRPTEPGDIPIDGLGSVAVAMKNIEAAKEEGGNPRFKLLPASSMGNDNHYALGLIIPE